MSSKQVCIDCKKRIYKFTTIRDTRIGNYFLCDACVILRKKEDDKKLQQLVSNISFKARADASKPKTVCVPKK